MTRPQPTHLPLPRRQFLRAGTAASAGLLILPSGTYGHGASTGSKLNIALIGCWGRASQHMGVLKSQNIVALCDVNEQHLAGAAKQFPKAKTYIDWRKCLEQDDIEAVFICSTDFTHAHISCWAMERGLHVYCEKPVAICVNEARTVRETFLKHRDKLATQVGTQRHADPNFARVRELIQDGAIGKVTSAVAWGNRKMPRDGYPKGKGSPPDHLHYDLWLGPAPHHPYSPEYFNDKRPGWGCQRWNAFWDFGTGQLGDMGSHTMDLVWNALDLKLPTNARAEGEPVHPEVCPVRMECSWDFPTGGNEKIRVGWYQGGAMPRSPKFVDLNKIGHGAMFKGESGWLVCDFSSRLIIPSGRKADMTYYTPRPEDQIEPDIGNFVMEWVDACKGDRRTSCDFEYAGNMMEMMTLGHVAYRAGREITYDAAAMKTDSREADAFLARQYREGFPLIG